jgi:hypothetical protein
MSSTAPLIIIVNFMSRPLYEGAGWALHKDTVSKGVLFLADTIYFYLLHKFPVGGSKVSCLHKLIKYDFLTWK